MSINAKLPVRQKVQYERIDLENGVKLAHWHRPTASLNPPFVSVLGFGQPLGPDSVIDRVDTCHSYTVDLRGAKCARAIFSRPELLLDDYVSALAGSLQEIGVENPVVEGQSWGAAVAQRLATQHPERLSGLVLTSASTGVGPIATTPEALAFLTIPSQRQRHAYSVFGDERLRSEFLTDTEIRVIESAYEDNTANVLQSIALMLAASALEEKSHTIDVPTMVISGTDDRLVPHADSQRLSSAIRDARFVPIEGAGHLLRLYPDAVATAINGLLHVVDRRYRTSLHVL